ncbi:MAG: murein biosynthesis integral membrane protein MurJ [Rhodospirillaceae bacterium]|nr:murein biosynthesis integral membrane protein MurJ [Rhodospirillaceae bacterium]
MILLRSVATVGGFTLVSRFLGVARDLLIARYLGAGPIADAFFVALRFPNLFRNLFAEGAFNAAFVPLYARKLTEAGPNAARILAERILSVMVTFMLILTVAAQFAMPWLMYAIAPGFASDPEKFDLAIRLTQITFPYLLFMSLAALLGGILNSLDKFAYAAAAPILLNLTMIAALVLVMPTTTQPGDVLAWSVALAGLLQFLWLAWSCQRVGVMLRFPRPSLSPEVKRLWKLLIPGLIGAGVMQINIVIGTIIASLFAGAVSYLYYADRIYQLPLGVIGVAIGVVLLPELTRRLRGGDSGGAMWSFNRAVEIAMLLTLPAAAALIAVPLPIVTVLFERGAFGPAESYETARVLGIFAIGLPAYVLVKTLAPGFYAREDTTTPFRIAIVTMIVNTVLSVALAFTIGFVGIAIATTIAAWVNAGLLAWKLRQAGHLAIDDRLKRRLPRMIAASLVMGIVLWFGGDMLAPWFEDRTIVKLAAISIIVGGGLAIYAALGLAIDAFTWRDLREAFRRRR